MNILLNGIPINEATNHPYLGLQLENNLKWDSQIMKICKIVSGKLAQLSRLSKFINKPTLNELYKTIIQPSLDYAISIWGYGSESNKHLVKRLQHRAARIVTGNRDYINVRGSDLLNELGWQTVEQRRDYFTATLMYKCIHGIAPQRLMNELVMSNETHNIPTRSTQNFNVQVPEPKYEIFRNSFRYQGALLWNSLPAQLKNSNDIASFKKYYKNLYFN